MRFCAIIVLVAPFIVGCERSEPKVAPVAPTSVEIGGPKGGIHVDVPAGGTKVDVDASGVHVNTPDTKVDAR